MYAHGNLANGVLPVRMNWHAIFENTPALNHSDVGDVPVHLAVPTTFCFICVDIKQKSTPVFWTVFHSSQLG